MTFRIYIDSGDVEAIEECYKTGLVHGVTTNPTLLREYNAKGVMDAYHRILDAGCEDLSMEVQEGEYEKMLSEALKLNYTFGDRGTIKLPMTKDGLRVCEALSRMKIRTNVTLIFNAAQAILASNAGATYVSPFVGRIDDQGYAGLEVVRSISSLYRQCGSSTQVLAASIRTPHRAVRSFYNGADVVTVPPKVFWDMYKHVLTDVGLEKFRQDAQYTDDPDTWPSIND